MKLLIIEDELDLREAMACGLEKKGYTVDTVADGEDGLYLIEINPYDLVILDLNLPGMDGLDVLCEVRKQNKELRILILSARSAIEDRVKGLELGANDYLIKPFHFDELEARIRNLLHRSFIQENAFLTCGIVTMDTTSRIVSENGIPVSLTKTECSILEYLLLHKDTPVSRKHFWSMYSIRTATHFPIPLRCTFIPCGKKSNLPLLKIYADKAI